MTSSLNLGLEAELLPAVLLVVGLGAALIWLFVMGMSAPESGSESAPLLPFSVENSAVQWYDAPRRRTIVARIYYPGEGRGPFPVILVSHSLRGSRDESAYLGSYWAGHGYICVHLQHTGSDVSAWTLLGPRQSVQQAYRDQAYLHDRIGDLRFVIDQLEDFNRRHHWLAGLLDLSRIGVAGQEFGSLAALALAGQIAPPSSSEPFSRETPCVKAAMALGEPSAVDKSLLSSEFGHREIPVLSAVAVSRQPAAYDPEAREPTWFDRLPSGVRYRVSFNTPNPLVFLGPAAARRAVDVSVCAVVQQTSQLFWDAYLKEDQRARAWLMAGQAEVVLAGCGRLRRDFADTVANLYVVPPPQNHYQSPEMWCC